MRCLGSPPRIRNLGLPKYDREDGSSFDLAKWIRSLSRYQNPGVGAGSSGSSELLKQLELGEEPVLHCRITCILGNLIERNPFTRKESGSWLGLPIHRGDGT